MEGCIGNLMRLRLYEDFFQFIILPTIMYRWTMKEDLTDEEAFRNGHLPKDVAVKETKVSSKNVFTVIYSIRI